MVPERQKQKAFPASVKKEEFRLSLMNFLSWGDTVESPGKPKKLEFIGQNIRQARAMWNEKCRNQQVSTLSIQLSVTHLYVGGGYHSLGKNPLKWLEEAMPYVHTGLGVVSIHSSQTPKPNSWGIWSNIWRVLSQWWGITSPRFHYFWSLNNQTNPK